MSALIRPLTDADVAALMGGTDHVVVHGHASLTYALPIGGDARDAFFVMRGASGTHTLYADGTPLHRLNAHWLVFASHPLNQMMGVAA